MASRKIVFLLVLLFLKHGAATMECPIEVTVEPPRQTTTGAQLEEGGVENFETFPDGNYPSPRCATYGATGSISACYSGGEITDINPNSWTAPGKHLQVYQTKGHITTIMLTTTGDKGVNYFGLYAYDVYPEEVIELWKGDELLISLLSAQAIAAVKHDPGYNDAAVATGADEPQYFINFFCHCCTIDKVVLTGVNIWAQFNDNHTFGVFTATSGAIRVPPYDVAPTTTPAPTTTTTAAPTTTTTTAPIVTAAPSPTTSTTRPPAMSTTTTRPATKTTTTTTEFIEEGGPSTAVVVVAAGAGIVLLAGLAVVAYKYFSSESSDEEEGDASWQQGYPPGYPQQGYPPGYPQRGYPPGYPQPSQPAIPARAVRYEGY